MLRNKKSPSEIDFEIGRRIKSRRNVLGLNQQHLAAQIDVSYQQVQKYENGTDRVGAARLKQIAEALDVPFDYFFKPSQDIAHVVDDVVAMEDYQIQRALEHPEGRQLMLIFANLKIPSFRSNLLTVARSLAETDKLKRL